MITMRLVNDAAAWNAKYNKPIMILEYGADTLEGYHTV